MGIISDRRIAEFKKKVTRGEASYTPASGTELRALETLKNLAEDCARITALEISGERDGNGCWSGCDAFLESWKSLEGAWSEYKTRAQR